MRPIKILIADDSVIYRSNVRSALSDNKMFEVVGVVSNGRLAIEKMANVEIDLLILDLEMPEMDGLQTLKNLKGSEFKGKVLVFASTSTRGAETALEALKWGATDFVPKPGAQSSSGDGVVDPVQKLKTILEPKILSIFDDGLSQIQQPRTKTMVATGKPYARPIWDLFKPKIVVIGASTGGPTVLEKVFSQIGQPLSCPVLIVQHMPPVFTATFAARLQKVSGLRVMEAQDGQTVDQNCVYVAPGNFHMTLSGTEKQIKINLNQGPLVNSVRPAVDPLFDSAAHIFKTGCLGIVFTGMGSDGQIGAEKIKENGGLVIIQEQTSCVVFGMPGAVKAVGAYDFEYSPNQIVTTLLDKVAGSNPVHPKQVSGGN
jgi:two-component system, chemotaxis family, protein-glutamate methylesterase/glutaminase